MKIMLKWFTIIVLSALLGPNIVAAGEDDPGRFSFKVYSDYYYIVSNHNSDIEGYNGFWLRRIYLTYDKKLGDGFDARLRFEMNSKGDFTSSTITPVVKDAYLRKKIDNHQFIFGISPTPTFNLVEKIWGYRGVEKTPLDLYKLASSRDFGLAASGSLDEAAHYNYHVMLANGSSNKSETNKGKKAMAAFAVKLVDNITLEVYGDFEAKNDSVNVKTIQAFAAYNTDVLRLGVQFSKQINDDPAVKDINLFSAFGVYQLSENTHAFVRVDKIFDLLPKAESISYLPISETEKATLFIVGLDFKVHKSIQVIPNLESVTYESLDNDIIPRLTFNYSF